MGDGDAWPSIRAQILAADILVMATPIWMGQPSSVTKRALERLDAELSEKDDEGRLLTYGKVAAVAVVGNEDGAHQISADLFQALDDVGFTLAAGAVTYWVGRAMETDYQDLDETPEAVASTTKPSPRTPSTSRVSSHATRTHQESAQAPARLRRLRRGLVRSRQGAHRACSGSPLPGRVVPTRR